MSYFCKDKYRLDLSWDKVVYLSDGKVKLEGALFSGPALRDAVRLQNSDYIDLDITPQLLKVFDSYYIVRLNWSGVKYNSDGTISLEQVLLTNDFLKTVHKLENNDRIIINTEKHEEATHAFHLVYESKVLKENKEPYKY